MYFLNNKELDDQEISRDSAISKMNRTLEWVASSPNVEFQNQKSDLPPLVQGGLNEISIIKTEGSNDESKINHLYFFLFLF